jgi:predicted Zn-dependent peptidase
MFKIKTLKNGARLVLAPRTGSEAVTLLVVFSVGSRQETEEISGVSHFIEHFILRNDQRPSTLIISQELDKIGAEYNAFTGKDYTGY